MRNLLILTLLTTLAPLRWAEAQTPVFRLRAEVRNGQTLREGQGVRIDPRGSVVTHAGVLRDAHRVWLRLNDSTDLPVETVVAEDPASGLVRCTVVFPRGSASDFVSPATTAGKPLTSAVQSYVAAAGAVERQTVQV
ncbi:MAG: hypothetical protein WBA12_03385, partial [Catalinimonas sp.]